MIVAGFGFRRVAGLDSLRDALLQASRDVPDKITALATLSDKAASPAFRALSRDLALPVHPVDPGQLALVDTDTQSLQVQIARQTGSVAEAAALVAAGPGAQLLGPRVISADRLAACALARINAQGDTP